MTERNLAPPGGVIAAPLTPLTSSLEPDRDALAEHCRWLLDHGCDGLAILGSTGEANSLTLDQRLDIIGYVADDLPGDRLLIGTGSCSVADAITLTGAAVARGLTNVLVLPPFYYRPVGDDGVFSYFECLIDAVGDPNLRIYIYNFPLTSGFSFSSELVGRLREAFGAVIAGLKDSSGDWEHMAEICATQPGFEIFAGTEKYLLDILRVGGVGCISATANVTSAMCQDVYRAWRANDTESADRLQENLTAVRLALQAQPIIPALKALMARENQPSGAQWQNLLPPLVGLDQTALAGLRDNLADLAFPGPGQSAA
ncbi:MAG: dihydrodipicolinate synthase family protein [Alphaproteobacteria bacterium]|nr:dihydrodipicolinate synthase family protein [Alphaproteobacteria bacterium]